MISPLFFCFLFFTFLFFSFPAFSAGNFSPSYFCDQQDVYSDSDYGNSAQLEMERATRRYQSFENPESPHPPVSPVPEDDPIFHRSPPVPNIFPSQHPCSLSEHYQQMHRRVLRNDRRVGLRFSTNLREYRDQIFSLSQAALYRSQETFRPRGTHPQTS